MIINADAIKWAKEYKGELFHALICDPPYHLTTITDRFGKEDSAPAQEGKDGAFKRLSTGFMGKVWDGGDIAFQKETWESFYNILFPGAFGMAFGGSRTAHRMAVAIEDAGFIIHPQMSWIYGSGFPKATRIKDNEIFEGHRYGLQALKPAQEPIIVFQKPYDGKPLDNIVGTGAGALNIDGGRIGGDIMTESRFSQNKDGTGIYNNNNRDVKHGNWKQKENINPRQSKGRWPSNFLLTHSPGCEIIGFKESDSYQINRFTDGAKPFGDGAGHEFESDKIEGGRVPVWKCVEGCPVLALDKQSGHLTSGSKKGNYQGWGENGIYGEGKVYLHSSEGDSGTASRFFHQSHWAIENADPFLYNAKVSQNERNSGLDDKNPHPTLKPIALIEHLATLLLPPKEYAPRRICVPFAGVASEVIGCWRAGWEEITGIELEEEYSEIGKARLEYWKKQGIQLDLFEGAQ